jgi:hypothetical protein
MTNRQRDRLRKTQNEVIHLAERLGYGDDTAVAVDLPQVTIGDLRKSLYPQFCYIFEAVLREWTNDVVQL